MTRKGPRVVASALLLTGALLCVSGAAHADVYLGAGAAVLHSHGLAYQFAVRVHSHVEAHYTGWHDGERDHALGLGYRFENGGPISVVLGLARVGTVTENLLRRTDAYIEVRLRLFGKFSCQMSHYSSVGDDAGENMLLCGMRW